MKSLHELIVSLRALPRPVWVLFLGTFLNRFGTFVMPFLALYLTRNGHSAAAAGIAIGAYGCGHLLASLIGGHLADTIGRRKTILLSLFSSAGVMLLFSQVEHYWSILLLAFVAGLSTEVYRPASSALLTDLVDVEHRVTAFAMYRLAINAGWAIGPAVGGWLAAHSYFWLFVGDAVTSALFGLLAWKALPTGLRASEIAKVSMRLAIKTIRGDVRFMRLLLVNFLIGMVFMQMHTTLGLEIKQSGFSEKIYGLVMSLNGILIVVFELYLTTWTRRFAVLPVMALGYLLCGIGFGMNALASSVLVYCIAMTVFTIGEMICLPVQMNYVSQLAPTHLRGRYMGVNGLTWALALIVGPGVGTWLFSIDPNLLWGIIGGSGVLAAVIILLPMKPSQEKGVPSGELVVK